MKNKFRAWDNKDKRIIVDEQDFIPLKVTNKGILRLSPIHKENVYEIIEDEDRFNFMQYTGLNDTHGTEIYEGDIVTYKNNKFKIKFEIGSFMLVRINSEIDMYSLFKDCWNDDVYPLSQFSWNNSLDDLEVIGNIYENPELLNR